jgi:hypothetical protein
LGLSWSSWYAAGVKPTCMVPALTMGVMPMSSVGFGYR